jgi:hypothetical protein
MLAGWGAVATNPEADKMRTQNAIPIFGLNLAFGMCFLKFSDG